MTIKVGDKVRRIRYANQCAEAVLPVAISRVLGYDQYGFLQVEYKGWPGHRGSDPDYFVKEENHEVAKAMLGGLQAHSVGQSYPICPVYYDSGDEGCWRVENLTTGTTLANSEGEPIDFFNATSACVAVNQPPPSAVMWVLVPTLYHGNIPKAAVVSPREAYQAAMEKEVDHL